MCNVFLHLSFNILAWRDTLFGIPVMHDYLCTSEQWLIDYICLHLSIVTSDSGMNSSRMRFHRVVCATRCRPRHSSHLHPLPYLHRSKETQDPSHKLLRKLNWVIFVPLNCTFKMKKTLQFAWTTHNPTKKNSQFNLNSIVC